jgi:hypothetical protein
MSDDAMGNLLRAMLGPPEPQPGPPFTHTLQFPEPELDDDGNPVEAYEPPPTHTFTERGRQYENGPLEAPAAFRRLPADPPPDAENAERYFPPL